MKSLQQFFQNYASNEGKAIYKEFSYAQTYTDLLEPYRGKDVVLVEFGIGYGGCLQMWREYLGQNARIYGIEKQSSLCYEEDRIKCICGDQGDVSFLRSLTEVIPNPHIVIDDASHINSHQISTLEIMLPHMRARGLYFCEDIHTSYRNEYGGGYLRDGTFVEYTKLIPDALNCAETPEIKTVPIINLIESITFQRSLIVIRKANVEKIGSVK